MVRERLAGLAAVVAIASLPGCSLLLEFEAPPDAAPDAPPDAPYTDLECMYGEPNDTREEAQLVTPTDVGPAALCADPPGETDFYRFAVPAGATAVTVSIAFMNRPTGDIDLRLLDSAGNLLGQSRGFGDTESITCPGTSPACGALAEGEYLFEVFPALPGAVNRYDFALSITGP